MPCLLVFIALAAPRLGIALLWFFTTWFSGVFATPLWPVLGFIFLPTTLLWYSAVQNWYGGAWNGFVPVAGLVVAVLIDLSPARGRWRGRRRTDTV
ncbi:MAG: hypothetical protein ACREL5_09780 [Gemmatimonadales bacterium]